MATYSLTNFAVIDGQFILIYDTNNQLRHSIIPHETQFYARHFDCVIEVNGISTDKYIVLDFSSVSEAQEATTKLNNLKHSILYDINRWEDITNKPSTIYGYTIIDAYTKGETDTKFLNSATTLNVGITLNNKYISGVKNVILSGETLNIPEFYEYNVKKLDVDGVIDVDGDINIIYDIVTLNGLNDINFSGLTNGDSMIYNDGVWKNENINSNFLSANTLIDYNNIINIPTNYKSEKTLSVIGWSNSAQTLVVTGVTSSNDVFISPKLKTDQDLWAANGVFCDSQNTNSLTFSCTSYPLSAITLNIKIQN